MGGQHANRCRDRLAEAIRTTADGSNRIAAHDVRSAGYDVVREEFKERHQKHSAWLHRPHVVSHRSLEERLSATRSQCIPRSEEKK